MRTASDRLEVRLSTEAKRKLKQAAIISGKNLSEFTVSILLDRAEEIIQSEHRITLSNRDRDKFLEALESDSPPNATLMRAARRYRDRRSA